MEEKDDNAVFSIHFRVMTYVGCWILETDKPLLKVLYFVYTQLVNAWVLFMLYMGILDLIYIMPDINKIFYNCCINPLILGTWIKGLQTSQKAEGINALQRKLERKRASCRDAEELEYFTTAKTNFSTITKFFYLLLIWLYPTWFVLSMCSEFWGERELPLPAKWPGNVDIGDLETFILIGLFHGAFALFFLFEVLSLDLSIFGLLVEIHREYRFLIKVVREFGDFCDEDSLVGTDTKARGENRQSGEINVYLKQAKAKKMLGDIIARQKELLGFTEALEYGVHTTLFSHIFIGGALIIVNGVQAIIVSSDYNVKMAYQFGYVIAIICDMLQLCWLTDRVSTKCLEVGTTLYSTPWYKMDVGLQKDICLVILRSQKPPRVTAGKFIELKLSTFMGMMKNIYSWLALVRQLTLK